MLETKSTILQVHGTFCLLGLITSPRRQGISAGSASSNKYTSNRILENNTRRKIKSKSVKTGIYSYVFNILYMASVEGLVNDTQHAKHYKTIGPQSLAAPKESMTKEAALVN